MSPLLGDVFPFLAFPLPLLFPVPFAFPFPFLPPSATASAFPSFGEAGAVPPPPPPPIAPDSPYLLWSF